MTVIIITLLGKMKNSRITAKIYLDSFLGVRKDYHISMQSSRSDI